MNSLKEKTVIIAESEPITRMGLFHLINKEPTLRVCGQAEDLPSARDLCAQHRPVLMVLDLALGDGLGFVKDLPQWSPTTKVVVYTSQVDVVQVQRAFKAGAQGFLTRHDPTVAMVTAMHKVIDGGRYVSPRVEDVMLGNLASGGLQVKGDGNGALSNREAEVLIHLGRGLSARDISTEMKVSVKTIETHCQRMKDKLGLKSGSALRQYAAVQAERKIS